MARCFVKSLFTSNPARMRNRSFYRGVFRVVHSRCWKVLRNVHNLFTCDMRLPSPAGLRLEISCESDKKKMNFIFNCSEKIFLNKKTKRACPQEKRETAGSRKFSCEPNHDPFRVAATN